MTEPVSLRNYQALDYAADLMGQLNEANRGTIVKPRAA